MARFSHAYDTCKSLKKNIYYLSMDVEPMSGPGFDMRVDLVTAVDCNDDSKVPGRLRDVAH